MRKLTKDSTEEIKDTAWWQHVEKTAKVCQCFCAEYHTQIAIKLNRRLQDFLIPWRKTSELRLPDTCTKGKADFLKSRMHAAMNVSHSALHILHSEQMCVKWIKAFTYKKYYHLDLQDQ